jgi:paraquat-inducible protein B
LIQSLDALPLEQIGTHLRHSLEGADRLMNSSELQGSLQLLSETLREIQQLVRTLDSNVAAEVKTTLDRSEETLAAAKKILNSNSPLHRSMMTTLQELSAAARSLRLMADYLERHPDAPNRLLYPDFISPIRGAQARYRVEP